MALAYLTINLDAFTGDDHPPDVVVLDDHARPGADHIDAAADVIHVRTIVVSLTSRARQRPPTVCRASTGKCRWSRASCMPCRRRTSCVMGRTTSRH